MMRTLDISLDFTAHCQNCFGEVNHDGDNYVCTRCKIYFDDTSMRAYYLDDDAEPCGHPYPWPTPVRDVHTDRKGVERAWIRFNFPCNLPSGHTTDDHNYPSHSIHCIPEAA